MSTAKKKSPAVAILMGSDSDLPIMQAAAEALERFQVPYELTVISAHRTPQRMMEFAAGAKQKGIKVIIAGAGGAAHVAGMLASLTTLPVIGVPILSKLNGLDSLLSTVQMPEGIPVATVAVNGAKNAGLLACRILGITDAEIENEMKRYQSELKEGVVIKAQKLEQMGYKKYLEERSK